MTKKYSKFTYLFGYSLKKRVKTKSFLISNIIIAIAVILLTNISSIIKLFGGDFDEETKVYLYDDTNKNAGTIFANYFTVNSYGEKISVELIDDEFEEDAANELVNDGIVVLLQLDDKGIVKADIYSDEMSTTDELTLMTVINSVKNDIWLLEHENFIDDLVDYQKQAVINYHYQTDDVTSTQKMILMVLAMFLLIPVFLLVIFLTQFVGTEIIEEKSSRSIEVIISNVPAGQHFASKILSAITFIVIQASLLIVYSIIGLGIMILTGIDTSAGLAAGVSSEMGIDLSIILNILDKLPSIITVLILFVVAGFFMYSVIIAIFSSMATTLEDFQTFQTPIMILLLVGFYLGLFGVQFEGSILVKIFGFIPLFSPMLAPMLFVTGEFGILEVIISFVLLVGFDVFIIFFGMPLYKVSILSYSQDPFFKRVKKLLGKSKYSE